MNHFTPFKKDNKEFVGGKISEMDMRRLRDEKAQREKVAVNMFVNEGRMPSEIANEME